MPLLMGFPAAVMWLGAVSASADPVPMDEPAPVDMIRPMSARYVLAIVDREPEVALAFGSAWAGYLMAQAENGKYQDCLGLSFKIPVNTLSQDLVNAVRLQDPTFLDEPFIERVIVAGKKLYCGWTDINRPSEGTGN